MRTGNGVLDFQSRSHGGVPLAKSNNDLPREHPYLRVRELSRIVRDYRSRRFARQKSARDLDHLGAAKSDKIMSCAR